MHVCMFWGLCYWAGGSTAAGTRRARRSSCPVERLYYIYISLSLIYLICLSLAYILYMCVYIYLSPVVVPRGALRDKAGLCKHISLSLSLSLSIYIYIYINVISVAASLTGEQTLKFWDLKRQHSGCIGEATLEYFRKLAGPPSHPIT